jgi:hypothetical protein
MGNTPMLSNEMTCFDGSELRSILRFMVHDS